MSKLQVLLLLEDLSLVAVITESNGADLVAGDII